MEIRGVEFTDAQFSMCLMISVGVDKYDAAQLGILGEEYVAKYKDFLTDRKTIKAQIDNDFLTFNF